MFTAYAVTVLSNFPPTLNLIAIFGLCYVTNKLVSVGMDLIQGIEIKDKNDSS
jgi:xanthosine utilization system XapX-like protein